MIPARWWRPVQRSLRRLAPGDAFAGHLFILGAQKAGTSALHAYLAQHPGIVSGQLKELGFYHRDAVYAADPGAYRSYFPRRIAGRWAIDSTPEYLYYPEAIPRIARHHPDAHLVVLLREPVSRAHSAFNMYQQIVRQRGFARRLQQARPDVARFFGPLARGERVPDIGEFLDEELRLMDAAPGDLEPGLIRRGLYAPQLARVLSAFPRERLLVLTADALRSEPAATVARVTDALGLPPLSEREFPPKHARPYTTPVEVRDQIANRAGHLFAADAQRLRTEFGLEVPW